LVRLSSRTLWVCVDCLTYTTAFFWDEFFVNQDGNDLFAMRWTWHNADIAENPAYR